MDTPPTFQPSGSLVLNTASGNSFNKKKIFFGMGLIILLVFLIIGGILYWKMNSGPSTRPVQVSVKTDYGSQSTPTPLISPVVDSSQSAGQPLDADVSNLDKQLGTLKDDQVKIDASLNETIPDLTQ